MARKDTVVAIGIGGAIAAVALLGAAHTPEEPEPVLPPPDEPEPNRGPSSQACNDAREALYMQEAYISELEQEIAYIEQSYQLPEGGYPPDINSQLASLDAQLSDAYGLRGQIEKELFRLDC